jgi:hypothetical protein
MSDDGGVSWTVVVDNGPLDSSANVGTVFFNGKIGTKWSIAFNVGLATHDSPPVGLVLDCTVVSTSSASLIVQFSDDGFGPTFGYFESAMGGTLAANVVFRSYVDPAGALFSGQLVSQCYCAEDCSFDTNSLPFTLTNYSLTLEAVITHPYSGTTGFDQEIIAIAPSPKIVPTFSNGGVSLSFPTQSGFTYGLEYKNNLSDNAWLPLQSDPGTGSTLILTDAPPTAISRFYRVNVH